MSRPARPVALSSRAAARIIEPGTHLLCVGCGRPIKFAVRKQDRQVIANVYEGGVWKCTEHFHAQCYDEAGEPYGTPASPPRRF